MPGSLLPLAALFVVFTGAPLALYRARHRLGLTPLWIYSGGAVVLLQFLSLVIPIGPYQVGFTSISIFPSLLALALLLYVRSGLAQTRSYILTIVGVTLVWSAVSALVWLALTGGGISLWVDLPAGDLAEVFRVTPRSMIASGIATLVDFFLILITWQWLENHSRLPFAARAILALAVTLAADAFIFVYGAFWPAEFVPVLLKGHLAGKTAAAVAYGLLIAAYVRWIEPVAASEPAPRGTLEILRYQETILETRRELATTQQRYRNLFENILDAVVVFRAGRIFDLNPRAEKLFGRTRQDLLTSSASVLGLPETGPEFQKIALRLADGREAHLEAASVDIEVEGEPARMVTLRDVSERERAAEVIRSKNRELEALNSVAELGIRNVPVQEVLNEAVSRVQALTRTDSCAICLASEDRGSLGLVAATGISEEIRRQAGEIRFGLLWKVFQGGQALLENDLPARSEARRDLMEKGVVVHATVVAPIVSRGRVIGTLSVCAYRPHRFGAEDAALLGTLGAQLGAVIENAKLIEDIRQQKEVSEILLAAATAFGRARNIGELGEALLEAAAWASGKANVALLVYDADRDIGRLVAISGVPEEHLPMLLTREWGPGNPVFARLRERREALFLTAEEMKRIDPEAWGTSSPPLVGLFPLFLQEHFLGAITVNFESVVPAAPRIVSILEGLAGLCAAALSNLKLWGVAERNALLSSTLLAVGQDLATALDPERVLRTAAERARAILNADAACVCVATPEGFRVEAEDTRLTPIAGKTLDPRAAFGGRILADPDPISLTDAHAPGVPEADRQSASLQGARSCLCVPMRLGGRVLGALHVANEQPRIYAREEANTLSSLATYTAICLENARLLQDLSISNEEIRDAQAQVVRSESLAAIGRLSAAIAHEIRNPLSGISAAAQALLRSASSESSSSIQLLRIIDRESKRLNRIITDFLQFARPRSPALRRVSVPALVDSTLTLMEGEFSQRVRVNRGYSPDLPSIQADGDQLKQVLLNLFMNAAQAMPNGGEIDVRARTAELPAGPAVQLDVADTGAGIPMADLTRVFEPFYSTKKEGTGLGLAIAHQIVSAHGGTITAHPNAGQGAMFRIVLPAMPVGAAAKAAQAP
ncbi:MAG: GAF domain-containing protein [Planctomycetes bacterium]|nr:GAF domain-containing protein [Planctomycetota bacterium]